MTFTPHLPYMRWIGRTYHTLDVRIRQYHSSLLDDVPQELVALLGQRLGEQHVQRDVLKIDRVRPGGPPRVRSRPTHAHR